MLLLCVSAGRAYSEKKYLMPFYEKTGRQGLIFAQGTPRDLEKTVAGMAVEMVMMPFLRPFIENTQIGVMDSPQPSVLDKNL